MKKKEKIYKNIVKLNRLEYKNKDFIINSNIKKLLRMHRNFIEYRCGYYGMGTEDVISDFLLYCYNKLNKRKFDDLEGGFITNKIKFIVLDCFKRKHKNVWKCWFLSKTNNKVMEITYKEKCFLEFLDH